MDALFMAGAISIVIGFLLRTGSREGTYDPYYQHFRTFGATTGEERRHIDGTDLARSHSDMWVLFTAGIIMILLSFVVYYLNETTFTYNLMNRMTRADYADSSYTTYSYDTIGRLLSITDSVSGTISYSYTATGCGTLTEKVRCQLKQR